MAHAGFFFDCYADHRDLHSFPTRRSSDLPTTRIAGLCSSVLPAASCSSVPSIVCCVGRDRKSTRLNSSHVEISYAVFCLKKKKLPQPSLTPAAGDEQTTVATPQSKRAAAV